jgi:serine/threonine protein kinase
MNHHSDLKPDNMLITIDGHIKLTDFGLSVMGMEVMSEMPDDIRTHAPSEQHRIIGTPDYLSPEVLMGIGFGPSVDWWALGIMTFEFLVGFPPFNDESPQQIFQNILKREIVWPLPPDELSPAARDLIEKLLHPNPAKRLGAKGAEEVKKHSFFEGIDWENLLETKLMFCPAVDDEYDTGYFVPHGSLSMSLNSNFQRETEIGEGESESQNEETKSLSKNENYLAGFTFVNLPGLLDLTKKDLKRNEAKG